MTNFIQNRNKAIFISSIGGGLEIYDFTIYIFFAPILAKLFFPANNYLITLIQTFSVFAVGYFARPLGAVVFGHFGDKFGRKSGMLFSIAIMAISTAGIGLLPTYESIGIMSTMLLVILRFFQGFSVGGDLPGAITFTAEYAEPNQRGLSCGIVYCAINLGLLLASLVGALLTISLSHTSLMSWGWRLAFLLGLVIGLVGLYLRNKIAESPYFTRLEESREIVVSPSKHLFRVHFRKLLHSIGLVWLFAVVIAQLFLYMPTYLNTIKQLPLNQTLIINSINILVFSLCIPFVGYLSDRIGRKPILLITSFLFIILSYSLYTLIIQTSFILEIIGLFSFAILAAGVVGIIPVTLTEMFPTHIRYSGVAISYSVGFAIFAGLTPVFSTYLLYQLQFSEAPALNLIFAALITFIAAFFMQEGSNKALVTVHGSM